MPDAVLGTGDKAVCKTNRVPCPHGAYILAARGRVGLARKDR